MPGPLRLQVDARPVLNADRAFMHALFDSLKQDQVSCHLNGDSSQLICFNGESRVGFWIDMAGGRAYLLDMTKLPCLDAKRVVPNFIPLRLVGRERDLFNAWFDHSTLVYRGRSVADVRKDILAMISLMPSQPRPA